MSSIKQFAKGFKKGFTAFGYNISVMINSILLLIVYILGVGITSVLAKIMNKRFLETKQSKNTYWVDLNLKKESIERYFRQF